MSRKRKRDHAVRKLRQAIGWTQQKLADVICVSKITIVLIETGRMQLSPQIAKKLEIMIGVDSESLRRGTKGTLRNKMNDGLLPEDEKPFSKDDYEIHCSFHFTDESLNKNLEYLSKTVKQLRSIDWTSGNKFYNEALLRTFEACDNVERLKLEAFEYNSHPNTNDLNND